MLFSQRFKGITKMIANVHITTLTRSLGVRLITHKLLLLAHCIAV